MAALTWRNVDAPDLRTSIDGIKTFSNLFTGALGGLENTFTEADQAISDKVNNKLALEAAAAQDPDAAKALAASLSGRADAGRISAQTLQAIQARPTELLREAGLGVGLDSAKLGLDDARYTSGRTRDVNARLDAARPKAAEYISLLAKGDYAGVSKLADSPELKGLDPKDFLALVSSGKEFERGDVDLQSARLGLTTTKLNQDGLRTRNAREIFELGRDKRTDADITAAQSFFNDVRGSAFDAASAQEAIFANPNFNRLSVGAKSAVIESATKTYDGFLGNPNIGTGGPSPSRVMGWSPRGSENSNASVDNKVGLIAQKIGAGADDSLSKEQFLNLDMTQLEGNPAGRNNFGNMKNTDGSWKQFNSPQEYRAAQRAWLERRYNEGARTVRDAVEGRRIATPAEQASNVNKATRLIDARNSQNNTSIPAAELEKAEKNTETDVSKFAAELKKTDGFKNLPSLDVENLITQAMRAGNVNAAKATLAIKSAVGTAPKQKTTFQSIKDVVTNPAGAVSDWFYDKKPDSERVINYDQLGKTLIGFRNGADSGKIIAQDGTSVTKQSLDQAQKQAAALQARLTSAYEASKTRPGATASLRRLEADAEAATNKVNAMLEAVANDPTVMPIRPNVRNPNGPKDPDPDTFGPSWFKVTKPKK